MGESKDVEMDTEKTDERKFGKFHRFWSDLFTEEDDEDDINIAGAGPIAMHASNRDDPLLEIQDDVNSFLVHRSNVSLWFVQGEDSDAEDYFIRPDDNLVVTAHIEDDTSSLEVYGNYSLFHLNPILIEIL